MEEDEIGRRWVGKEKGRTEQKMGREGRIREEDEERNRREGLKRGREGREENRRREEYSI